MFANAVQPWKTLAGIVGGVVALHTTVSKWSQLKKAKFFIVVTAEPITMLVIFLHTWNELLPIVTREFGNSISPVSSVDEKALELMVTRFDGKITPVILQFSKALAPIVVELAIFKVPVKFVRLFKTN